MNAVQGLARFGASVRLAHADADVQRRICWIVADCVAAIVAGSAEPEMQAFGRKHADGTATLLGLGGGSTADIAALVNGSSGTFLEMDEGNRFAHGHPGIHVVPAALAWCETNGAGAATFLTAVLAGYEVGSRIAAASRLRSDLHPHGTWGTVGAAVSCGSAAGVPADRMAVLVNIASSLMTVTSKRTMLEGGLVRNVYAGLSNRNGLLALQLLDAGFSGEADGLRSMFGSIVSDRFDEQALLAALPREGSDAPSEWHVMQNYFKLHSCCRYNHGVLDAMDDLQARGELPAAADVERVEVVTYALAAELDDPAPANTLAAKFSIPFAVATRLVHRSSGVASFTWDAVRNQDVLALARRVTVREDLAMTRRAPQERPARVTVVLRDGTQRSAEVSANRGDDTSPYSESQLTAKFIDLTGRAWPRDHCERVLHACLSLAEPGASLPALSTLLRRAPTA